MLPQVKRVFVEDCGYIAVQMHYCEPLKNIIKQQMYGTWRNVFRDGSPMGMAWCVDPLYEPSLKHLLGYSKDEFSYDAAFLHSAGIRGSETK